MTDSSIKKSPLTNSNIKELGARYDLLARRRSSLVHEMSDHPAMSRQLHSLRRGELKMLRSHLAVIEDFLQRYGFVDHKGGFR